MNNNSVDQDQVMGHVKIIRTPEGEPPQEIREAWVGLILLCHPVLGYSDGDVGALSHQPTERNRQVISVPQHEAICILGWFHPDAAQWWRDHGYPTPGGYFSFGEGEIEIVSGVKRQQVREWTHHDDVGFEN